MRGRRVARLSPWTADDPLADLRERGLVQEPQRATGFHAQEPARSPARRSAISSPSSDADRLRRHSALIKLVVDEDGSELADEL
jgi:hypothetical protein